MPELAWLWGKVDQFLKQVAVIHYTNSKQLDLQVDSDNEARKRLINQLSMVAMPNVPEGLKVHVLREGSWVLL